MISDKLAEKISNRLKYDFDETKRIFQDFDDRYIERAIQANNPQCMRSLTSFIEKYVENEEIISHLRGYKDRKEEIACWEKWEIETKGMEEDELK